MFMASDWLWNEKIKNKVIIETEPILKSKLKSLIQIRLVTKLLIKKIWPHLTIHEFCFLKYWENLKAEGYHFNKQDQT